MKEGNEVIGDQNESNIFPVPQEPYMLLIGETKWDQLSRDWCFTNHHQKEKWW